MTTSNSGPARGKTTPESTSGSFTAKTNSAPGAGAVLSATSGVAVEHNAIEDRLAIEDLYAARHAGQIPTFVDPPADGTRFGTEPVLVSLATPDGVVYDVTHEGKRIFARSRSTDTNGNPQPFNTTSYGIAPAEKVTPMAVALAVVEAQERTSKTRAFNDHLQYEVWHNLIKSDVRGQSDKAKLDHRGQAVFTDGVGGFVVVKDFSPALTEPGPWAADEYAHEDRMTVVFGKSGDPLAEVSGWHDFDEAVEIEVGRDPRTGAISFRSSPDEGSRPIPNWLNEAHSKRCEALGGPSPRGLLVAASVNHGHPHHFAERMSQPDAKQRLGLA